ncbi:hypothetical protein EJMOOK_08045 [Rhodanobacter sp. Root179]|uniref:DUF4365 domain-containing protein n=1 Tax=Rhodanobacter sp. Root179 TaxID=1736482 RepID=UPI0009E93973|nr:DUF4365 domain-containing protein [Rhodanobacter sp. Root179]
MNFPEHQKTGALAEIDVERLFTSWNWNVGQDRIDVGYDLCVMPDRTQYQGARFLVQVKGTTQKMKKGAIVASVSKNRLRQYAEDRLPVFIVRATPDGALYWMHAQSWTHAHRDRLTGFGNSGVRFDPSQKLNHREAFESYLKQALRAANADNEILSDFAEESRFLNSLDPRLGVHLSVQNKAKRHELFARSKDFESKVTFIPRTSPENLENLREVLEFGLPRSVEVENFKLVGSPLLDELGKRIPEKGMLTIGTSLPDRGVVRLYPGKKYSVTAQEFALDAELFRGTKGIAISNETKDSACDLNIRLVQHGLSGQLTINIGFRVAAIASCPIRDIDALRPLAIWAEQIMAQRAIFFELAFMGVRPSWVAPDEAIETLYPFLRLARTMSKLHLVAKALGSTLTLAENFEFSTEDIGDIDLAFALLKGERRPVDIDPMEFDPVASLEGVANNFYCTTILSLEIFGQPLGEIPVGIDLSDFLIEKLPNSTRVRLSKGETGQAWISYAEHDNEENRLVRKHS